MVHRSIPAFNADVEAIQKSMEEIAFFLRIPQRKPWGNMAASVDAALAGLQNRQDKYIHTYSYTYRNRGWDGGMAAGG